jgi:hypothetical protein
MARIQVAAAKLILLAGLAGVVVVLTSNCSRRDDRASQPGFDPDPPFALPADFPSDVPYFVRVPAAADWSFMSRPLRFFTMARKWGPYLDLRHSDLRKFDLTDKGAELPNAFFDSETRWPEKLPAGFAPAAILELNRDPGLGLRAIQARGITGRGVSVGIIDTPVLLDHAEYAGRMRLYGEANGLGVPANFHGTLVTSILAGRTCGVAPEVEIYYMGSHNYDIGKDSQVPNAAHYAQGIDRLLEVNARLPREKKIRVISISAGWGPKNRGFKAMNRAVERAEAAGIFVVSANLLDALKGRGLWFWGFDRRSTDSPDDPALGRVLPWKEWVMQVGGRDGFDLYYAKRLGRAKPVEFLVLPEGSKTVAHPGGREEYGFYRIGGWSSISPYLAGLYALACQVDPDVTPEGFWRAALATGDPVPIEGPSARFAGKIVHPAKLIEALRPR